MMNGDRSYNDRLSIGMRRAWQEAKEASRAAEEAKIQEKRRGFRDRLQEWQREVDRNVSGSMPRMFSKSRVENEEPFETSTAKWEISCWKKGSSWHFHLKRKTGKETTTDDITTIFFDNRKETEKAVEYAKKVADTYSDLGALSEVLLMAVCPHARDFHAPGIARGTEWGLEKAEYFERWICN
ncbi:MAG: hypothetical protein ABEL51_03255 [Salinibacter sp.]